MNPEAYEKIWQSFFTGDHISQYPIGRGEGLALGIPVEDPEVLSKIGSIQASLAKDLPFCAHLPEALHITLCILSDVQEGYANGLAAFLHAALARVTAFQVELKRVNSFFRAPFLEVHGAGALDNLLSRIRPGLENLGYPGLDYGPRGQVWHVTLGVYTQSNDGTAARKLLQELRFRNAGSFIIRELRLVKTFTGVPFRMETLAHYRLAES